MPERQIQDPAHATSAVASENSNRPLVLLKSGMTRNAVSTTPATDPNVLTKNTRPAPASPFAFSPVLVNTMTNEFSAENSSNGAAMRMIAARRLPTTKCKFISAGKIRG